MDENELSVDGRQLIINDNVDPLPEAPEVEVEDSGILFWFLVIPFLFLMVGNNLKYRDLYTIISKFPYKNLSVIGPYVIKEFGKVLYNALE